MPDHSRSESEIIDRIARNPHPQRLPKNDDSSSSRESSPDIATKPKRSFTPSSDDEDAPEIPNPSLDDTPPPPDKPVIRQALGFAPSFDGTSASSNVNTYQAKPITANDMFLPGQTVAPPPVSKSKKTKTSKPKKTRKKEEYATQTGRFRLSNWNTSSTSTQASVPSAPQPSPFVSAEHSSVNHNNVDARRPHPHAVPTQPPQNMFTHPPPQPSFAQPSLFSNFQSTFAPTPTSSAPLITPATFPRMDVPNANSTKGKTPEKAKNSKSSTKATKQKAKQVSSSSRSNTVDSYESTYYRRDYENQSVNDDESDAGPSSAQFTPHLPKQKIEHVKIKQSRPSRPASRMVTVLITDIRSGMEDNQLAEVVVPLKEADTEHPEYGFWANAQEVVEKLQSTPSRVEGPARVYTMRGKYRQFFLRVREDNSYEAAPANISISEERTLQVVVEAAALPGELPAPPRIPRELRPSPSPELDDLSSTSLSNDIREQRRERKRYRSLSEAGDRSTVDYDESAGRRSPTSSITHYSSKKQKVEPQDDIDDSDAELFITPLSGTGQTWSFDYETPTASDDENLDANVANRIDPFLQTDSLWEDIFRLKAKLPRVPAYIEFYRALQSMFDRFEGRRAPFRRDRNIRIQKVHILKALRILDEKDESSDLADADKICANCSETLKLVSLYGSDGTRLQDPEVREMMENESQPEKYAKPQKRFLRKLREIDEKWKLEHPEDVSEEPSLSQVVPASEEGSKS